ncbi:hypothetical protein RRG08_037200 [Elysia crispata]|uniref:Uncharacterized protein n=1 Tax=Elysia crispata TaxID=231223 RepID=A0AAE1DA80_9GAST|nr:hypothetical protein RRG08_037200 [Elysia crispata]
MCTGVGEIRSCRSWRCDVIRIQTCESARQSWAGEKHRRGTGGDNTGTTTLPCPDFSLRLSVAGVGMVRRVQYLSCEDGSVAECLVLSRQGDVCRIEAQLPELAFLIAATEKCTALCPRFDSPLPPLPNTDTLVISMSRSHWPGVALASGVT